jgi:hypothetical protein
VNLSTVPPYLCTTAAHRFTSSVMISRNRSISRAAAISIERTTSANSTVTCLYSAASTEGSSGDPHASQNRAPSCGTAPHDRQTSLAGVTASAAAPAAPTDCLIGKAYGLSRTAMGKSTNIDVGDYGASVGKDMLTGGSAGTTTERMRRQVLKVKKGG